tara:strand:+ start:3876 stop:5132 length:1257 start_codon:yes stop_codon:yes gene_type:complete
MNNSFEIIENLYVGNYMSDLTKFDITINVAKEILNIKATYNFKLCETTNDELQKTIIHIAEIINNKIKNKKIIVFCHFGMNRSVSCIIGYLMMYRKINGKKMNLNESLNLMKKKNKKTDIIPIYITKLKLLEIYINKFNDYTVNVLKNDNISRFINIGLNKETNYNTFTYPTFNGNISKLSKNAIYNKQKKIFPDKAKNINNRLRNDHDDNLIDRNEKEKNLLESGYYNIPNIGNGHLKKYIELTDKFVTDINADAVVNTANEALLGGGGMDLLIHQFAGESLNEEIKKLKTLEKNYYDVKCYTGDVKITTGHNLPFKYIVHVVTPYLLNGCKTNKVKHMECYDSILNTIDDKHISSLVIGPISTGYYGYPMLEAAILGLLRIRKWLLKNNNKNPKIKLWIYNKTQYNIFKYLIDRFF